MIIKVKEPIESEYGLVREGQLVFTYFHFACDQQLTEAMIKKQIGVYGLRNGSRQAGRPSFIDSK